MVTGRIRKILLDAEVDFRRNHRGVSQRKLDLLQWSLTKVCQPRERPPEGMRGGIEPESLAVGFDNLEYRLR